MGRSGDVTISNLKSATSIADDRLSAHHPDGPGTQTKMSDFFCQGIEPDSNDSFFELEYSTDGGSTWQDSSDLGSEGLEGGDKFRIGIKASDDTLLSFHPDGKVSNGWNKTSGGDSILMTAFVKNGNAWPKDEDGVTRDKIYVDEDTSFGVLASNGVEVLVHQYTIDSGVDSVVVSGAWKDGGYNSDMTNYNNLISFLLSVSTAVSASLGVSQPDSTVAEVEADWRIEDGDPTYSFELRRYDGQSDTSGSYDQLLVNKDYTTSAPHDEEYMDSNVSDGTTYTYEVYVNDGNSDTVYKEETIDVITPD